jgi:hypothetical protein
MASEAMWERVVSNVGEEGTEELRKLLYVAK